jgi:PAS domain S-box-containing protein
MRNLTPNVAPPVIPVSLLYERSPIPHFAVTRDGTIVELNRAAGELLGTAWAASSSRPSAFPVAESDRTALRTFLEHTFAGRPWSCDVTLRGRGGVPVPVRLDGRYLPELDLSLVVALELSGAGRAPAESVERSIVNVINEQTDIVICVKDREGKVLYLNPAMSCFLGKPPEKVIGACDLEPIADAEQVARIRANDRRIIETGATECVEESGTSAAGPWTYLFTKSPFWDRDGNVVGIVGIGLDITARKEAEEALKRYAQRLVVAEDQFRKRIAIELHDDVGQEMTALAFNLAHIESTLGGTDRAELRSTLEDCRQLTRAIHRSVRGLMVSLHPPQLEELGLVPALASYAKQFQERTGIAVALRTAPGVPRLAAERELALFRIVQEALNNVLKHAAATRVSILLEQGPHCLRLSLTDDGRGVALRNCTPQRSDSGWGITIMRERAESVGGSFAFDSAPGRGTTISVEFPK